MDAFIWNERYMTGESIVDTEHQELVRIINLVVEKVSSETPEDEIKDIMDRLVQYAVVHFRHEEELMTAEGCDPRFIAQHIAIHLEFGWRTISLALTRRWPGKSAVFAPAAPLKRPIWKKANGPLIRPPPACWMP